MDITWIKLSIMAIMATMLLELGQCLECYACSNQDSNQDKCIKTSKQCEEHQDMCITTVAWGLPPYWTPYGERYHYVWKDCDTRQSCEQRKSDMNKFCKRDWYDDWSCIECCAGDFCNYYVTLDASSHGRSLLVICTALLFTLAARHLY